MDRSRSTVTYQLLDGSPLTIHHYNKPIQLGVDVAVSTDLKIVKQPILV